MQAYGFVETSGMIASIEALDIMLKTANVELVSKEKVSKGITTIIVRGDVSAVKASVDAGIMAVNRLGESFLLASHVIPRLDQQTLKLFKPKKEIKEENNEVLENLSEDKKETILENNEVYNVVEEEIQEEVKEETQEEIFKEIQEEQVKAKQLIEEVLINTKLEILENTKDLTTKEGVDELVKNIGISKAIKEVEKLKVPELKTLIKKYKEIVSKNKKILRSNKNTLLQELKNYYKEV